MLKKFVRTEAKDWDQLLPYLLSAVQEVTQASIGFFPFKFLYGRQSQGMLNLDREFWEANLTRATNVFQCVIQMRERTHRPFCPK